MIKIPEPPKHLPDRQKLFFLYYLQSLNATQAAIKAGFSPKTALKTAYLWVGEHRDKCPKYYKSLWDAVHEAKLDKIKIVRLNVERILQEMMSIAFFNHKDLLDPDTGLPLPFDEIPDEVIAGMKKVKLLKSKTKISSVDGEEIEEQTSLVDFQAHSKMDALKYLAKFLQIDPTLDYKQGPAQGGGETAEIGRVLKRVAGRTRGLPGPIREIPVLPENGTK